MAARRPGVEHIREFDELVAGSWRRLGEHQERQAGDVAAGGGTRAGGLPGGARRRGQDAAADRLPRAAAGGARPHRHVRRLRAHIRLARAPRRPGHHAGRADGGAILQRRPGPGHQGRNGATSTARASRRPRRGWSAPRQGSASPATGAAAWSPPPTGCASWCRSAPCTPGPRPFISAVANAPAARPG
jgi:hypothetical protein